MKKDENGTESHLREKKRLKERMEAKNAKKMAETSSGMNETNKDAEKVAINGVEDEDELTDENTLPH